MIKKGIVLSGGIGSRMSPITKSINKQLLPLYNKPLIFYSLSMLMLAKIKDILIIVNKGQVEQYKKLIPNGDNLLDKIEYYKHSDPKDWDKNNVKLSLSHRISNIFNFSIIGS